MVKRPVHQIEKILKTRTGATGKEFFVKWQGLPASENSWVAEHEFTNARYLLKDFCRAKKSSTTYRRGSFSLADTPQDILGLVYEADSQTLMAEVQWQESHVSNTMYAVDHLHIKCPSLMCKFYRKYLKLIEVPKS